MLSDADKCPALRSQIGVKPFNDAFLKDQLASVRSSARLGEKPAKQVFESWLKSSEFGESRYFAEISIKLAQWYEQLPKKLRRLVIARCETWNLSWLEVLCRKAATELEHFLLQVKQIEQRDGKITAASLKAIATSKKSLTLGQLATDKDWELIVHKYGLSEEQLKALKAEAQRCAEINPNTGEREITTNSIVEALKYFNFDPSLVLPKPKAKRYSQDEVDQIRQEIEGQVHQKYQAQFEEIRAQAIAEYKAQAQQQVGEAIATERQRLTQELETRYATQIHQIEQQRQEAIMQLEELKRTLPSPEAFSQLEAEVHHLRQEVARLRSQSGTQSQKKKLRAFEEAKRLFNSQREPVRSPQPG